MSEEIFPDAGDSNPAPVEDTEWSPEAFEVFFRNFHSPKDEAAYYAERYADIDRGLPTWMVDDLHDHMGRMYKFYDAGNLYGFIQENYERETATPYYYQDGSPVEIEGPLGSLGAAVLALKKHYIAHRD